MIRLSVTTPFAKSLRLWLVLGLALMATSALAQSSPSRFRVSNATHNSITVSWRGAPGVSSYGIQYVREGGLEQHAGATGGTSFTITGLKPNTTYTIFLDWPGPLGGSSYLVTTGRTKARPGQADAPVEMPPADTCPLLPASIVVSGQGAHTQCQQVGAAGVGIPELIAQGIVDAVDIYYKVDAPMLVCFRNAGRLKFLDSTTMPRTQSDLTAEYTDGLTCGRIDRIGTVVLLQGGAAATETTPEISDSPPPTAPKGPASTTICQLETTHRLSLRTGPSVFYARLLVMPRGESLVAQAKIGDWFMVNYDEQLGWASGGHLAASPGCDALSGEGAIILPPMTEPSTLEAKSDEQMADSQQTGADADATESTPSDGQTLAGCQVTTADIVNLRAGPGLEYDIIAEIPYQTHLNATATSRFEDWFRVDYEDNIGWVSRQYVFRRGSCDARSAAAAVHLPPMIEAETVEVKAPAPVAETTAVDMADSMETPLTNCTLRTGDIINFRAGPGLQYDIMAEIPIDTILSATARSGDWFKVDYANQTGWVNIDYVFRNGACG